MFIRFNSTGCRRTRPHRRLREYAGVTTPRRTSRRVTIRARPARSRGSSCICEAIPGSSSSLTALRRRVRSSNGIFSSMFPPNHWRGFPEAELAQPARGGRRQCRPAGRTVPGDDHRASRDAHIVTRGGPGREAWGHPLEPSAQYNHTTEDWLKPPLCPWRIEVGDTNPGARTLFLHVFELGKEGDWAPSTVTFEAPAGAEIGGRWHVRFNPDGPLGGAVNGRGLATAVEIEAQYATQDLPGK